MSLEKIEFRVQGQEGIGPAFNIEKLYNVDQQDVENWCKRFKRIMVNCKYSSELAMTYLLMSVDEKYHEKIEREQSIADAFKVLMQLTYNKDYFYVLLRELDAMHVGKYQNIDEFAVEFEKKIKMANLCLDKANKLTAREIEDKFKKGLCMWMQIEYARHPRLDYKEKIEVIRELELVKKETRNKSEGNVKFRQSNWNKPYTKKFEPFNSNINDGRQKPNEGNKMIRKKEIPLKKVILNGNVNGQDTKFLIDTGATSNYVSNRMAKDLITQDLEQNVQIEVADGNIKTATKTATKTAKIEVELDDYQNVKFKTDAIVMPGNTKEVILGMKFLVDNDVVINFRHGTLGIDGVYSSIPGYECLMPEDPEGMIVERFKTVKEEMEIDDLVEYYKVKNPGFGRIKGATHRIELIDSHRCN